MKKSIIIFIILMVACLALTACGGGSTPASDNTPDPTLESWMAEHPEEMEDVEEEEGMEILFEGNTLIYKYDITVLGIDEETATSDEAIAIFEQGLDDQEETFKNVASSLEKQTGISGIEVKVVYTFGDTVLIEKTFT